ncbi:MAG: hypothetical protein ACK5YI_11140 [Rhodospirillales bacterium]|jgi:chemotaxis regulatin CheY-phosphate phosphatase CheZ
MAKTRPIADTATTSPAADAQDRLRALVQLIARSVARELLAAEAQRPSSNVEETP